MTDGREGGWIIAASDGAHWRVCRNGKWEWTKHRGHATVYPTRDEAEDWHADDEAGWRAEPATPAAIADTMRFRLMQEGQSVAGVEGPSLAAMREASHYLAVYSQDGPCHLQFYTKGRRWRDVRDGELENAIAFRERASAPSTPGDPA